MDFVESPGSKPNHFLLVQHTTYERTGLKEKWIGKDGDLIKAHRLAQEIRKDIPDAEFTVILATNQHLSSDDKLLIIIYKKADEFGLDCDIWEQTRLANFLDDTSEGHWLRREYLGIEAELLSETLLRHICRESLVRYENDIPLSNPRTWVQRDIDEFIREGISENKYTFQVLIGESGLGKSVAAFRAIKRHVESREYGLWTRAELIQNCTSLENALDKVLLDLYPSLLKSSGKDIKQFIKIGSKFILIIEGINQIDNPQIFINRLLNWSKPYQSNTDTEEQSSSPYQILCPIWPQIWNHDQSRKPWVHTIFVGPMSPEESLKAVGLATLEADICTTSAESRALIAKLGNDPALIGMFSQLIDKDTELINLSELAEDVVEKFITRCIDETASYLGSSYLPIEYRDVLSKLCLYMLKEKRFYPYWEEILAWFREDHDILKALRELIQSEKLCRLTAQENRINFRHDRIRTALLVESMISILENPFSNKEILQEPYYAELIGRAIVLSPQSETFIEELAENHPLVLFEALKNFGTSNMEYCRKIVDIVKDWVETNLASGSALDSVINSICWCLLDTDSPALLDITARFPRSYWPVLLARLRNGCARSGAAYCGKVSFSTGADLRDQMIEHAKRRHRQALIDELRQLLTSVDLADMDRKGILVLTGFLEFTELETEIAACWNLIDNKEEVLAEAIWAAARCYKNEPNMLLGPMMDYWATLSNKSKSNYTTAPRYQVAEELLFGMSRGIRKEAIDYFINLYAKCEPLRWPITIMFERIDTPEAIEFIIRATAKEYTFFSMGLPDGWDPSRPVGRKLSQPSMDRLRKLWISSENEEQVKYQAFRIWISSAQYEQTNILKEISSESPLYRMAIRKRAKLGDKSVVQELASLLTTDVHLFDVAHNIWCKELMGVADQHLRSLNNINSEKANRGHENVPSELVHLLTMIPVSDAELLLEKNWENLRYIPKFIQVALYVGTEKCLKLADSSIQGWPDGTYVFKHLNWTFGFHITGRQERLTIQHLDRLVPYLDRFEEDELWGLADVCQSLGIPEWKKEYISSKLTEMWRKRFYPSDEDLFRELDEFIAGPHQDSQHLIWMLTHWVEKFDKRHDSRAKLIMEKWLESNPTVRGLSVIAAFLKVRGTRKDLAILDKYEIEGSNEEISKIKSDAKFAIYRRSLD